MKKAQIIGKPIIYIGTAVIMIFLVIWGITQIQGINERTEQARLISFTKSLENTLKTVKSGSFGDVDEKTFSLPSEIEEICFVDNNKDVDEFKNNKLRHSLKMFPGFDVFIFPAEKFNPLRTGMIRLKENENPLCLKAVNEKIKLGFENKGSFAELSSKSKQTDSDCVSVVYNGEPEKKIDMVFLGYGYDNAEGFAEDVDSYINGQFSEIEPFKSNLSKINFYRIDSFNDLGCEITDMIRCDNYKVKQLASQCPNDYIFVLAERGMIADLINPIRSSAIGNVVKVNTADNPVVIMHELGHAFANLADEYVDDEYYGNINFQADAYPNCDIAECPKWSEEFECYGGCSLDNFFRSVDKSIMRSLSVNLYGPLNTREILERLVSYE